MKIELEGGACGPGISRLVGFRLRLDNLRRINWRNRLKFQQTNETNLKGKGICKATATSELAQLKNRCRFLL